MRGAVGLGFRRRLANGLDLAGLRGRDAGLHLRGAGAGHAPEWYVLACLSFDLLVAAYVVRYRDRLRAD